MTKFVTDLTNILLNTGRLQQIILVKHLTFENIAFNRVFVRSGTNFVIGDEWFCSILKLKMGDSSKMV